MKSTPLYLLSIAPILVFTFFNINTYNKSNGLKKIEKKVIKIAKERNVPSLELTINSQKDILNFSYNHKEVKKQNIYGIGSATKLFVAVLVFKLVEERKLNLDDKVINYIKLKNPIIGIENITIKNLLNHTSGLHDYTKNPDWMKNLMSNNAPETFNEKLLLIENTLNNKGNFTYSNTNYLFLEKIVESVTKKPFQEVFNKFYSKIDLPNIKIGVNEEGLEAYFGQTEKGSSKVSAWREYYGFDGGVYTNSKTLDTFLTKLYKDISILKPSTIAQMETWTKMEPMTIPIGSGVIYKYGYGVMKLTYNDQEYVGHPGGTLKYQSFVFYNAKKDISISVVSNCSGRYFNNIFFQELIPAILDEL